MEHWASLQAKAHIQDQAYSALQMLIEAVGYGLPWHAGFLHIGALIHRHMRLWAARYRFVCLLVGLTDTVGCMLAEES